MNASDICKRLEAAKGVRMGLEPFLDEAIRLCMPGRPRFHSTDRDLFDGMDEIYDETGANATSEFVSRIQSGAMPPFQQFLRLEAGADVADKDRVAVNADLEEIANYAFEEIWASNFSQETNEALFDMALTTGLLNVEDPFETGLYHRAVPITQFYIERGANGGIGGFFRERKDVPASDVEAEYGRWMKLEKGSRVERIISQEPDRKIDVVEYTVRDFKSAVEKHTYYVLVPGEKEIIVKRELKGEGSSPFIGFRWSTVPDFAWGRGPLMNAMAAVRTTNLMVELVLENAAMSIVGIYQTDNDATINSEAIRFAPGSVIAREIGTRGLEQIQTATGNFNMRDVVLNDQRLNIRRAMFNDMLADPNKTPATATEVAERMADLAQRTASGFSRLHYEFLVPYMRRVLFLLEERGDIQLPVVNGRQIKIVASSPLAQAQNGRDVQMLMQDFTVRAQMLGPEAAMAAYDFNALHPWLIDRMGLDSKLFQKASAVLDTIKQGQQSAMNAAQTMEAMRG